MSWQLLDEEIQRYYNQKQALKQIAEIVANHPEWFEVEPELQKLLDQWNNGQPPKSGLESEKGQV